MADAGKCAIGTLLLLLMVLCLFSSTYSSFASTYSSLYLLGPVVRAPTHIHSTYGRFRLLSGCGSHNHERTRGRSRAPLRRRHSLLGEAISLHKSEGLQPTLLLAELHYRVGASVFLSQPHGRFSRDALRHLLVATDFCTKLDRLDSKVASMHALCKLMVGDVYSQLGATTQAIAALEESLELSRLSGDDSGSAQALVSLSVHYKYTGQQERGLHALQEAGALYKTLEDSEEVREKVCTLTAVTGLVLQDLGRHDEALATLEKRYALALSHFGEQSTGVAKALMDIASAHFLVGSLEAAIKYNQRAEAVFDALGQHNTRPYSSLLMGIGITLYAQLKVADALSYWERCLAIQRRFLHPEDPQLASVLGLISQAHTSLGRHTTTKAAAVRSEEEALKRRSQIACAGPDCDRKLRKDGAPVDVCVKCRRTFYCNKACQNADWIRKGGHKAECKALIAEAKAAAAK